MEVILKQEVSALGKEGDVVKVARGYANNYLIPRGLAVLATPGNLKQLEQKRVALARREAAQKSEAEALKDLIEGKKIKIKAKAGEGGRLYGSITSKDIALALEKKHKVTVEKRKIELPEHLKEAGTYEVKVRLHGEIIATVSVEVTRLSSPEAVGNGGQVPEKEEESGPE